jgi:hypothetical protein
MEAGIRQVDLSDLGRRFFAREVQISVVADQYTRDEIISLIRDQTAGMAALVKPMTSEEIAFHLPGAPEGWDASEDEHEFDISQIVTHVAVATVFYWFGIAHALGHPRPRFPRAPRDAAVTGKTGQRFGRGGWKNVPAAELVALLDTTTTDFLAYTTSLTEPEEHTLSSYEGYGELSIKGWLLLLAIHFDMHLKQIQQLQQHPDYPGRDHS